MPKLCSADGVCEQLKFFGKYVWGHKKDAFVEGVVALALLGVQSAMVDESAGFAVGSAGLLGPIIVTAFADCLEKEEVSTVARGLASTLCVFAGKSAISGSAQQGAIWAGGAAVANIVMRVVGEKCCGKNPTHTATL